jgi:nucleoside-diphosphate-sugar epimerase
MKTNMRILITGHRGFVGRCFCKFYQEHDIIGIDILDPNNPCDARDFFKKDFSYFDLVIHLAAIVGGRATIEGNPLSVATDLAIDSDMVQWALKAKPGRIVYFSSSAAYPIELQTKDSNHKLVEKDINLNSVRSPDLTYGWSKLSGEYLCQFLEQAGQKVNVFRPFSGYGSDQDLSYPFPSFIKRAVDKDDPFKIWGDGFQTRDFIHIDDIVEAVNAAVTNDIQGPVNLGWGRPTNFNQLAELVCKPVGYKPELFHHLEAPIGVYYRVSDPNKMLSFYTPKITLEEGIDRAIKNLNNS